MKVGSGIASARAGWSFGDDVPAAFTEHALRSIPGYLEGHDLICRLSDFFVQPDSAHYDLGCSNGILLRRLAEQNVGKPTARWVGIDREEAMTTAARTHCGGLASVDVHCDDIVTFAFERSDFIVAHYVIQFVQPRVRQQVFDRIYEALNWGGGFVLFEKVRAPDARFQDMMTSLLNDFKREQGFTPEEILNKADSLKSVLHPFSTQANLDLMSRAGFVDVMTVFKSLSFEGFLAIK